MIDFIVILMCIVFNAGLLYFVVRKATRSDEQIRLLQELLAVSKRDDEKSTIQKLIEERAQRTGLVEIVKKTDSDYLKEARERAGV
ncbi:MULTISPECIES: YebO family protein [Klebsiella/Raoultella group]|uniref:YebO family protein n=1 Tax=Klebsiella/Raoultella group TaxID=2890311 RepID=UPI0013EF8D4E|nr:MULTISPECIES: YebO family protein [Klebsiella/Raoultella group]WPS29586.1 YebO family protein [Klebsiella aerogenes]